MKLPWWPVADHAHMLCVFGSCPKPGARGNLHTYPNLHNSRHKGMHITGQHIHIPAHPSAWPLVCVPLQDPSAIQAAHAAPPAADDFNAMTFLSTKGKGKPIAGVLSVGLSCRVCVTNTQGWQPRWCFVVPPANSSRWVVCC
jgi:hypothetical protein